MLNIVLFGPPGAGKGTQSKKLIEQFNLTHISTGDLFRKHLSEGSDLGRLAQQYMDKGNLVPDEVVIKMVDDKISHDDAQGFVFDGFPRTVNQAIALDELMNKKDSPISKMIALQVPEDIIIRRLQKRALEENRVDDKDEEKIRHRIHVYQKETLPVADYYRKQNKFHSIDGTGSVEDIFERISTVLKGLQQSTLS